MNKENPDFYFRDKETPGPRPSWEFVLRETEQLNKKVLKSQERNSLASQELKPVFKNDRPKLFTFLGDMHWFSLQTDYKRIREALNVVATRRDAYCVLMGDEMEGEKSDAPQQMRNTLYSSDVQLKKISEVVNDLTASGKMLGVVGEGAGHAEWIKRFSGVDGIQVMADKIVFPDGSKLKILGPWSIFAPEFANSKKFGILLFHNPGGGSSDEVNPNGAVRKRVKEFRKDPRNSNAPVVGAIGADKHHRGAVSVEMTIDPVTGEETKKVLVSLGAFKGTDLNNQDEFLSAMGKGPSVPPGYGMVVIPRLMENGGKNFIWNVYGDGFRKSAILHEAAQVWDAAERQNTTRELLGEIFSKSKKPKLEFDERRSMSEYDRDLVKSTRLYRRYGMIVDGPVNMPYRINFAAHLRLGSESGKTGEKLFRQILFDAEQDPYTFVLVMRHIIDDDVAKRPDRKKFISRMIEDLRPVYNQARLAGIMMSECLRRKDWSKDVKRNGMVVSGKFRPGDAISSELVNTPLFTNNAKIRFSVGSKEYLIQALDHLGRRGSSDNPFRGLAGSQDEGPIDIVVGGHMPGAGFEMTPFTLRIAPGWFAEYDSDGVSNKQKAPPPGQSADLYRGLVFSAEDRQISNDQHTALMLHGGTNDNLKKKILNKIK